MVADEDLGIWELELFGIGWNRLELVSKEHNLI